MKHRSGSKFQHDANYYAKHGRILTSYRVQPVEKAELAFNQGKHFRWKFLKTICCGILKNLQLENVNVPTDESKENFYFKISFPCNTLRA